MSQQVVVPAQDSSVGLWLTVGGPPGPGTHWDHVNEPDFTNPDDGDYIGLPAPLSNNGSNCVLRFAPATVPDPDSIHTLWIRASGDLQDLNVNLIEFAGPTGNIWSDVAVFGVQLTGDFTWYGLLLSEDQIAAIGNYGLLGVRFARVNNPSAQITRVTEIQLRISADIVTAGGGPHYSESTSEADCIGSLAPTTTQDPLDPNDLWSSEVIDGRAGGGWVFGCVSGFNGPTLDAELVSDDYWRLTRVAGSPGVGCARKDFTDMDDRGLYPVTYRHDTGFIAAENFFQVKARYRTARYLGIYMGKRGTGILNSPLNGGTIPMLGGVVNFGVIVDFGLDGTTCTVHQYVNENGGSTYELVCTIDPGASATEWIITIECAGVLPSGNNAADFNKPTIGDIRQIFIEPDAIPSGEQQGTDIKHPYLCNYFSPLPYRGTYGKKSSYSTSMAYIRASQITRATASISAATSTSSAQATRIGGGSYVPPPTRSYTPVIHSTRLDAVNYMLRGVGEMPISSLDTNTTAYAAMAVGVLDDTVRETMTRGWHWNSEYSAPYSVSADGTVTLPSNVVRAEASPRYHRGEDLVARGPFLYSKSRNSYDLSRLGPQVYLDTILLLAWEDLPEAARRFIMARAARLYQEVVQGNSERTRMLLFNEQRAEALLMEHEIDVSNANMLTNDIGGRILNRFSNPVSPIFG